MNNKIIPASQARCNDPSLPSPRDPGGSSLHPVGFHRLHAEDVISERLARVIVFAVFAATCIDWEPMLSWVLP